MHLFQTGFHLYDLDHLELRFVVCIIILREIYTERISNAHTFLYPSPTKRAHTGIRAFRAKGLYRAHTWMLESRRGAIARCFWYICVQLYPPPAVCRPNERRFFSGRSSISYSTLRGEGETPSTSTPWNKGGAGAGGCVVTLPCAPPPSPGSDGAGCGRGPGNCARARRPSVGSSTWSRASARSPTARKHAHRPPSPGRS